MARYNFNFTALGQMIRNHKLVVPIYQRPYAWTQDRVKDFWDDITVAISRREPEYFIGTVVISDDSQGERKQIIDGQQRIATVTILLSAIRDFMKENKQVTAAETIQSQFIASYDLKRKVFEPKIMMSSDDNQFFKAFIVEGRSDIDSFGKKPSNELIVDARDLFDQRLRELKQAEPNKWYDAVTDISRFVEDHLKIVMVSVSTEADAFTIFETLNDRGMDLTVSDLLKNYLFGRAGNEIETVRDNWVAATGVLESTGQKGILVDFLRHLWSSMHGATREKDLYASIKERISSQAATVGFSSDIYQASQVYAALFSSDHEYWRAKGSLTRKSVQTLIRLDLEQLRPLLLSVLRKFPEDSANAVVRALINWAVRGLVAGGIGGGKTEKAYTSAAMKVHSGAVHSLDQLRKELAGVIKSDAEFGSAFSRVEITTSKFARYFLLALEGKRRSQKEPELVPNEAVEEVNLEHVLPRKPKPGDWDQFSMGQKRAYTQRLGNMVLLRTDHNTGLGNKPWREKRAVLAASKLILTSEAGRHEKWISQVVDQRQKELAELAVQTWPA